MSKDDKSKKRDSELIFDKQKYWIDNGIDIDKRRIEINDVDECYITDLNRALITMIDANKNPIDVYISSFGGSVYDGLAIYDILADSGCKIRTHCLGKAMSMGFVLFLVGDERYCGENATFMAHQVSSISFGHLENLKKDVEETERLNQRLVEIIAKNTKKSKKWWEDEIKHVDKFYDKKQAKKLGIINE